MFYRARYYDPVLKRFISEDPAGLKAGLNGYRYVDNAPTEFSDPDGEIPVAPIVYAYLRCVASCMAQSAAGAALFDELECFDVGDNAKHCALDCLNPFNWGGKAGARNAAKGKSWPTKRKDHWKENGRPDGTPPDREVLVRDKKTGQEYRRTEKKELHHIDPQRNNGSHDSTNLKEVWPGEHAKIDPHRRINYEVIKVLPKK